MPITLGATRVPVLLSLWTFFALLAQTLVGQAPPTISSFPYQPSDAQQASDFKVNYGTGPATGGSPWSNGTIASPRQGEGGTNVQSWANRPTANYQNNTTTWLHSPIFNFSGQSGLVLEYKLWIRAQANQDGMKLQVSINGGTLWSDVTGSSVAYNGNTNTSNLLASRFGGGNACWTGTGLGGATANTCWLNLNSWAGQSDVRFRWCFVSNGSTVNNGPVLDGFKVVHVTSTTAYASGFAMVPQGQTVLATITKTQGQAFAAGMTVLVEGYGVTGTVTNVIHADQCEVAFAAAPMADILSHVYYIRSSTGQDICRGTMEVFAPQQLIANRESGSPQEPPQGATVGATSVYLHNGEFRHDLPIVSMPGRMLPLGAGITYRSALEYLGALGRGWSASFDVRLVYLSDQITLYDGQGRIDTFTLAPGGASGVGPYILAGFFVEFFRNDNGTPANDLDDVFTLYGPQGSSVAFLASNQDTANRRLYRQTSVSDRFGNKIQLIYNALGQLEQMRGDLYDPLTPSRYV
ncbi:MAG: hypothetical protein DYH04_17310, partial [Nitrospira sp. NTP2]|nr:hypothetical protein [Nitrospira sp. NTP2]